MASDTTSRPPSPTRGAAIEDYKADEESVTQHELRESFAIDTSKQIRLVKLLFMRYQHPDLHEITVFLQDFGLTVAEKTETARWFKGYGPEPYVYYARKGPKKFLGGAFAVETYNDLEKALQIPNARILSSGIESLSNAPGGGHMVTLQDPEGFPINLVYGQQQLTGEEPAPPITFNYETHKPRVRKYQRFTQGPAPVYKLGHYGLVVGDFQAQFDFYTQNFNIMPTNILYVDGEDSKRKNVAVFAHLDRGEDLVDHHTLFLVTRAPHIKESHVHHCSFEIHDFDTQLIGHDWLLKKQYKPAWGVGRHILGSQIFDYWWDPNRFMVEHYIDGDVVNQDTPVSFHSAKSAGDAAWGPEVPTEFME